MGIFDFIKPKKESSSGNPVLPAELYQANSLETKDVIAPSALKISPKSISLGDKIVRTYFVISYPRYLNEGWFSPIINLDKVFDIAIFIHPTDTAKVLKSFQQKVAQVQSQIMDREKKGFVRDPMLETAYHDLENLRDNLMQAQEKMFDVGLYLNIYGDSEEEITKEEEETYKKLQTRKGIIKIKELQLEGKKVMTAAEFLNGYKKLLV
jgi:hypothetical protein